MKSKQGISLIVLVITIIVMIILAASVVISLTNTGIIGKANNAVDRTNMKQIESLASLAWADAFMEGARTQEELQAAVDEALKDVDTSKYDVIVTDKGVTVVGGDDTNNTTTPTTPDDGGLYDASGNMIVSWEELVNKHGLDVTTNYTSNNYNTATTTLNYIITNNSQYATATTLKVSNTVTKIGEYGLAAAPVLKITIPSSVKEIGNYAMCYSQFLTSVTLEEGLETLGQAAFAFSSKLASIQLPQSLKVIGKHAFIYTSLTTLSIPKNVQDITSGFAAWSQKLTTLTVDESNPYYKSVDNVIYSKDGTKLIQMACGLTGDFNMPEGVTVVGSAAMSFVKINSVTIPASVTTLENNAMEESELASITFAENSSLQTLGVGVFMYSQKLTSINIPEGVQTISKSTFNGCTALTELTLPSTVATIESFAFDFSVLSKLTLKSTTPPTVAADFVTLGVEENTLSIIVPKGTGDAYKSAAGWSDYAAYITETTE